MQRSSRRRWILASGAFTSVAAIGFACSFPDPEIRPLGEGGIGQNDGSVDGSGDGNSDPDAFLSDVVVLVDGQSPDALIVQDAGKKLDATTGCDADCDCDDDGFDRPGCGNDAGQDCDDTDQRVRPDQGFLEIPGEPPRNGDWNCKNGIEELYPKNVSCGGLALGACNGVQGFSDAPKCGEVGNYVFCGVVNGLFCAVGATQSRTQACK